MNSDMYLPAFEAEKRQADYALWAELNRLFPNLACNVHFEHKDAAGWWYSFALKDDARRQTIRVNPEEGGRPPNDFPIYPCASRPRSA